MGGEEVMGNLFTYMEMSGRSDLLLITEERLLGMDAHFQIAPIRYNGQMHV